MLKKKLRIITAILFSFFLFINGFSQGIAGDELRVIKTEDFELNGKGDARQWNKTEFNELKEGRHDKVPYRTKFKILYSSTGIYCLYSCEDNFITATMKEDFDDIYKEDVVEAFFWTDETSNIYFEYEVSPTNLELPILVPNYKGQFLGWRPWHYEGDRKTRHATNIEKKDGKVIGWTAEFFIPYKLLEPLRNVPPTKGMKWRANFYRIDYDKVQSSWTWKSITKNFHDYERFGTIVFE
jgi:hypothetical protein